MTEGLTRPRWPESMAVVASTGTAVGAIGDAVILEGRLPDSYQHHSAVNNLLSFGLRGSARIEWKRGGRLSRFVGGPGCFTITPAGEDNSILHGPVDADVERGLWHGSTSRPGRPGVEALRLDHRDLAGLPSEHAGDRRAGAGVRVPTAFAPQRKWSVCRDPLDPDRDPDAVVLLVAATRRARCGWNGCPTLASGA